MVTYIRTLYPVNNILPISHKYKDFSLGCFISYSLGELRSKLFTDKYLWIQLNVLNLILSKPNRDISWTCTANFGPYRGRQVLNLRPQVNTLAQLFY